MGSYEKAKQLLELFGTKVKAILCVNEVIKELEDYGKNTDELQNMETIIRYWHHVIDNIKKL